MRVYKLRRAGFDNTDLLRIAEQKGIGKCRKPECRFTLNYLRAAFTKFSHSQWQPDRMGTAALQRMLIKRPWYSAEAYNRARSEDLQLINNAAGSTGAG